MFQPLFCRCRSFEARKRQGIHPAEHSVLFSNRSSVHRIENRKCDGGSEVQGRLLFLQLNPHFDFLTGESAVFRKRDLNRIEAGVLRKPSHHPVDPSEVGEVSSSFRHSSCIPLPRIVGAESENASFSKRGDDEDGPSTSVRTLEKNRCRALRFEQVHTVQRGHLPPEAGRSDSFSMASAVSRVMGWVLPGRLTLTVDGDPRRYSSRSGNRTGRISPMGVNPTRPSLTSSGPPIMAKLPPPLTNSLILSRWCGLR